MTVSPWRHRCQPATIDYSAARQGLIRCTACGRVWHLTSGGWVPDPLVRTAPA